MGLKRLIAEIHRRSIWQVLAIYLVGSWAAYQAIVALHEGLGLPDWVPPLVVVLFLVGLPVVLATAFVQEGGPRNRPSMPSGSPNIDPTHYRELNLADDPFSVPEHPIVAAAGKGPVRSLLTWNRAILGGVLAFAGLGVAVTLFMGMRLFGIGPAGTLMAAGVLDARERILLADFASADTVLANAVGEAFRVDFEQSDIVTVVDASYVRQVLVRMQRATSARFDQELAQEVAVREGIKAVIAGEINNVSGSYVLSARLVGATTGDVLASFRESAPDSAAILPAIDKLSQKLRAKIGESLKSVRSNPRLDQVSTSSLEALRKYSQGVRANDLEGNIEKTIALLEEAVALDTAFAMAWRKLGVALTNRAGQADRAAHAMTQAFRHRERLTDRERYLTIGTYYDVVTGELDKAATALQTLIDTYPDEHTALHNLGRLSSLLGDLEGAASYNGRAIAADSTVSISYINQVVYLYGLNRLEEAEHINGVFVKRFPMHPRIEEQRAGFAYVRGQLDSAEMQLRAMQEKQQSSVVWRSSSTRQLGALAVTRGRLAEGERHMREWAALSEQQGGNRAAPIIAAVAMARIDLEVRGNSPDRGLALVDVALKRTPLDSVPVLDRPYTELVRYYARAHRVDRARAVMTDYEREWSADARRRDITNGLGARAEIAFANGDIDAALQDFIAGQPKFCRVCLMPEIGRVHERAGRADSAIAAYEAYATQPVITPTLIGRVNPDSYKLAFVYERLGELYEQRGDRAKSAEYYGKLVNLWQDADSELQPRVTAARRRLEQLATDRG